MGRGSRGSDQNRKGGTMMVVVVVISVSAAKCTVLFKLALNLKSHTHRDDCFIRITQFPRGFVMHPIHREPPS